MLTDDLEGWEGRKAQEGGDIYICIYIYMYNDRFALLYSRNQHNIVKQFSSN